MPQSSQFQRLHPRKKKQKNRHSPEHTQHPKTADNRNNSRRPIFHRHAASSALISADSAAVGNSSLGAAHHRYRRDAEGWPLTWLWVKIEHPQ